MVLVDDSDVFRKTWELEAEEKGIRLVVASTPQNFKNLAVSLNINTPLFIDVNLSADINGIGLSEWAHKKGFCNIYLLTGENISKLAKPKWIISNFDKLMSFEEIWRRACERK
jgi:hypothetical protein